MPDSIPTDELALLRSKAAGFDRLIHDVAKLLPPDAAIKKLSGLSLLEALDGYELKLVPKPAQETVKKKKDAKGWTTLDELYELEAKYTATVGHR